MTNDIPNPPMSNPPPPMMSQPAAPPPFYQVWVNAVTKPNERTYSELASSPNASATIAFVWVFLTSLILAFFNVLVGEAVSRQLTQQFGPGRQFSLPGFGNGILNFVCGAPIGAVIVTLGFALGAGIIYLVARAFNGRATYAQYAYALAAIYAPVSLVSALLSLPGAIPNVVYYTGFLSFVLLIYTIVLQIIAVKAIGQITWLGAAVSVLVFPFVVCLCIACVLVLVAGVGAYALGNVFSGMGPFPTLTP